ncbi:MAG: thioredoxin [Bacteroidales bacterium]|nr:thioredoxin [Bacteroidales bacterium]
MKNVPLTIIAALLIGVLSCSSQPANNNDNANNTSKTTDEKSTQDKPIKLTQASFKSEIWDFEQSPKEFKFKGDLPVVIDFYADWCGPCRMMSPILDELAKEYSGKIRIYKINTDHEKELAAGFGIRSLPSFLFIPVGEGTEPFMDMGFKNKEMFKQIIDEKLIN